MRKLLYEVIEAKSGHGIYSMIYDCVLTFLIIVSLVPLMFKTQTLFLRAIDITVAIIFIIDYLLRWSVADYKYKASGVIPFLRQPFSFMAIIDLLSILAALTPLNNSLKILKLCRLVRVFRVTRMSRLVRYSKSVSIIINCIKKQRYSLLAVSGFVIAYILLSALVLFTFEPDTFTTYFDAVYLVVISLATIGYGDMYPVTVLGKTIMMISALVGIGVIALPSGIITASYMNEITKMSSGIIESSHIRSASKWDDD